METIPSELYMHVNIKIDESPVVSYSNFEYIRHEYFTVVQLPPYLKSLEKLREKKSQNSKQCLCAATTRTLALLEQPPLNHVQEKHSNFNYENILAAAPRTLCLQNKRFAQRQRDTVT